MANKLLASAPTAERLEKMAQAHYYSPSIRIEGNTLTNSKGVIAGLVVVQRRGRYRLEQVA